MIEKYDRLVILQTEAQAIHYSINSRKHGDLILGIGSEAMCYAESRHWNFCFLSDFFDSEHYQQSQRESERRIEHAIYLLDEWSAVNGLEMGKYYGFQLWIIIGQIHYNYFLVESIVRNIGNKPILIYSKKREESILELRPDPERIFFDVFLKSKLLEKTNTEVVLINGKRKFLSAKNRILNILPSALIEVLRFLRDRKRLPRCTNKLQQKLLLIGGGYDWFKVAVLPKFNEVFCIYKIAPHVVWSLASRHDKKLLKILDDAVTFDDVKVHDVEKLKSAIQLDNWFFTKEKKRIQSIIKRYKAVVTGVLTYPRDLFHADMVAKVGKKLYVWQHGEKGQSKDYSSSFTELYYATDYLAYAPMVARMYRESIGSRRLERVHTVGSLSKKIEWCGDGAVLYATGKWFGTATPFLDKSDPDQRLYFAHKAILRHLNSIGGKRRVIFKANNTAGFNLIPYRYENIDIEYKTPFAELLSAASVVILDTPATTLVEACSTNVPIFVLGGRSTYLPEFMNAVRQRVAWYETPEDLVDGLSKYFATGAYNADVNNDLFLKEFCSNTGSDEVCNNILRALN